MGHHDMAELLLWLWLSTAGTDRFRLLRFSDGFCQIYISGMMRSPGLNEYHCFSGKQNKTKKDLEYSEMKTKS